MPSLMLPSADDERPAQGYGHDRAFSANSRHVFAIRHRHAGSGRQWLTDGRVTAAA